MLITLAKSAAIALIAGVLAWLPYGALNAIDGGLSVSLLPIALLGSFAIGLPIALVCLYLAGTHLRRSPGTVFLMANFAGAVLLLASYVLGQGSGLIALGAPSVIAANTFALLGWFWILKPERDQTREALEQLR
ncbi:MAG: hypothetical protein AAFQ13_09470 [Pseudomonadota bacterium]